MPQGPLKLWEQVILAQYIKTIIVICDKIGRNVECFVD